MHSGIASGADVILLPEFPYEISKIMEKLESNKKNGKDYAIIAVAEGAYSSEMANLSKKERKQKLAANGCVSVGFRFARELQEQMPQKEIRVQVVGHSQRGGEPCAYDKILASRVGIAAAGYASKKTWDLSGNLDNFWGGDVIFMRFTTKFANFVDFSGKLFRFFRICSVR